MEPLKQFICDKCGEIIEKPEDGYVIWREDTNRQLSNILIVHHNYRDDYGIAHDCDNNHTMYPLSLPLVSFLGSDGLVNILSMVDPGPNFIPEYRDLIGNKREFMEFVRRVQIPYYEEARIYWDKAQSEGFFVDANEDWTYLPDTLKELIARYKE